jgi:chromosome segregation ATPase
MINTDSQVLTEMQLQLLNISNTIGQIQATLIENSKHSEEAWQTFRKDITELWGALRLVKEESVSKKEVDALFAKIRTLEDAPKNAALERQQTIIKWIIAPFGIIIGGWVLFMLTKIGFAPPK